MIRVCLAVALLVPSAAMAQGNPGPFGKLFGRAPASTGTDQTSLDVRADVGGQYYDSLLESNDDGLIGSFDRPAQSGFGSGVGASILFDHLTTRWKATLGGGVARGQYFDAPTPTDVATVTPSGAGEFNGHGNVHAKLSTRFEAGAAASYSHSPYFSIFQDFGRTPNFADDTLLPVAPYAVRSLTTETLDASGTFTTRITERSTLELFTSHNQTRFSEQPDNDLVANGYRATWSWQIQRGLGVHAAYGQSHIDQRGDGRTDYERALIDIGVDYNRQFSIARRTTIGFRAATSLLRDSHDESRFRVNGGVNLSKQFRRTWSLTIDASRETSFIPGFFEPLFSNNVGIFLGGMFTKRLDWTMSASAGQGTSAFSSNSGFRTAAAASRLSFALGKHLSAYGQYIAYWYELPRDSITFGIPLPSRSARQVVAVGLSLYLPVYQNTRPSR